MHISRLKPCVPLSLLALSMAVAPVFGADEDKNDPVHGQTNSESQPSAPSSHISKAILSAMPAYNPPKKVELPEGMTEDDVVVLDPVHVRERKQPRVRGWDMMTEKGRAAYLKSRYRGATIPGAPMTDLTYNYAKLMNAEDIRVENLTALQDLVDSQRAAGTSTDELKALNEIMLDAKLRPNDWKAESMDKSANNGRR